MNWLTQTLMQMLRTYAKSKLLRAVRTQLTRSYLELVRGSRRAVLALLAGILLLQLVVLAGVGALVTGVWLLDLDGNTKLAILFGTFSTLFLVPLLLSLWIFSESFWFRISGAERMMNDLGGRSRFKDKS